MILGLGCDIVQISRFAKDRLFLVHFMKRCCSAKEISEIEQKNINQETGNLSVAVATRFAAKEAVSKALGSGFRNGISMKDIEIVHDSMGCPAVNLYAKALSRAYFVSQSRNFRILLTLSNEREYVNAVAVLECL